MKPKKRKRPFKIIIIGMTGLLASSGLIAVREADEVVLTPEVIDTATIVIEEVKQETVIDSSLVQEQLQQLWELTTVKYGYTGAVSFSSQKVIKDFKLPFTNKFFIFTYDGYIKAGIDLSTCEVTVDDTVVYVSISNPKIFDNVVLEDTVRVVDQSNNVINSIKIEDIMKVLATEKVRMESRAVQNGLLDTAKQNAESIIKVTTAELGLKAVITYK